MEHFAINLLQLRKAEGLSQTALAKKIGVTTATISSWERGDKVPSLDNALRIAEIYNVSLDWLCGRTTESSLKINNEIKTAEDFLNIIFQLAGKSTNVTINGGSVDIVKAKEYGYPPIPSSKNESTDLCYAEIKVWNNKPISDFFESWRYVRQLYLGDFISQEIYDLCLRTKLLELGNLPSPTIDIDAKK